MFTNPIRRLSSNLEALRNFVDTLSEFLQTNQTSVLRQHSSNLVPMMMAWEKLQKDCPPLPPPEALQKMFPYEVEIEELPSSAGSAVTSNTTGKSLNIKVKGEGRKKFEQAIDAISKTSRHLELLNDSSLMNLTSIVELFFSEILHCWFEKHFELVEPKEKVFSFEDLKAFSTIADARSHYTNERIESILYKPFFEWIQYIKTTGKLSMNYINQDQDSLIETFLRRNLVVHNGGVVNSIYLSKVPTSLKTSVNIGERLTASRKYLDTRIAMFEKNCILIACELWKKLDLADSGRAKVLADLSYLHLCAKRWELSEAFSQFLANDKTAPESLQCVGQCNYWLCKKRQKQWEAVRDEVTRADFSAKCLRFQLALAALRNDADTFFKLIPASLKAEEITAESLNAFPIFEEMRADKRFDAYRTESAILPAELLSSAKDNTQDVPSTGSGVRPDDNAKPIEVEPSQPDVRPAPALPTTREEKGK